MKKKLLSTLICAAVVLGCAACGASENADSTQQNTTGRTEEQSSGSTQTTPVEAEMTVQNDRSGIYGTEGEVSAYDTENSNYSLTVNAGTPVHDISDTLFGIFIEDINFAADGGLYAEMVCNRSFEFTKLARDNERHAWSDIGEISANVVTGDGVPDGNYQPLNENNPNYMKLSNTSGEPAGIANKGFLDGMAVTEGAVYDVSAYIRGTDGYTGAVYFAITVDGEPVAEETVPSVTDEWHKYEVTLTSPVTANRNVRLQVLIDGGAVDIDFVSMFPQDTYKGRKNGLRKDLAEKLEALEPKFLRFPGGCVTEGYTLDLAYDWKDSIGVGSDGEPLVFGGVYGNTAARKQGQNIWTDERSTNDPNPSYMSYGLGFYEYFLLAEDLNALSPLSVTVLRIHRK